MFAPRKGLGFRLMSAIGNHDIATIMAVALLLSIMALSVNAVLMAIDHRVHHRA